MTTLMNGVKADSTQHVKGELSEAGTPRDMSGDASEDGEEEDSGELTMPRSEDDQRAYPPIWLTRVPNDLWHGLKNISSDLDEPIRIGTIKVWTNPDESVRDPLIKQDIRLCLDHKFPELDMIPKDWKLGNPVLDPRNTFIFSEKNVPGFKSSTRFRQAQKTDRVQKGPLNGKAARGGRRSIPKKTTLAGYARHEFTLHPVENAEYERVQRAKEEAVRLEGIIPPDLLSSKSRRLDKVNKKWEGWTKTTQPAKAKRQVNKTSRIPQNELMDKLVGCFTEYAYWPFKVLVRRVKQPEAYVKETLGQIAVLVKTGPFANHYMLSAEWRELNGLAAQMEANAKVAPDTAGGDTEAEGEGVESDAKGEGDSDGGLEDVL